MSARLSLRWLPASDRVEAGRVWAALERELGNGSVACSWRWTETWLEHYGEVVAHRFAVAEAGGRPRGIVLVTRGPARWDGPVRIRTVHLGTAGEPRGEGVYVEYNRVLAHPSYSAGFAAALIDALSQERGWDELNLDGFGREALDPFLRASPGLRLNVVASPATELAKAADADGAVLTLLKSGTRRKVRRSVEALGELETEWASSPGHALDILGELVELHQRRWTDAGEPGAFASSRFRAFHAALVPRLLEGDSVILFRVRARQGTVGCLYHYVEGNRALFYQSGLRPFPDSRISPGFVCFALCMQACYERGLTEYDFLAGDSRYKRDLATTSRELFWATLRRPAVRWRIRDSLAATKRMILRPGTRDAGPKRT